MKITDKQKKNMLHALGNPTKKKIPYRNRYCTYGDDPSWEDLVKKGLATKHPFPKGLQPENGIWYCVSNKGLELLGVPGESE